MDMDFFNRGSNKPKNNSNSNTFTETIEEVDPRTGGKRITTRTVTRSSNMHSDFGNMGGFGDGKLKYFYF